ncbi:LysM peptidoglycan-binding domain-containing protein [Thiorhodococcus minor]|uniref:LysM peptidoglycan-binding domain-containing protein n=1 Tax=Thiorhodococcus minor TaxID=57489 RepID=A0A6M0JU23_9GAMM|nr:LysM domain-containing protein [Thiorhodococcus minor]NEV61012.1 LysM peptidoglycan-binding domain-containing protein [Thiorhodococcus minor]
MRALNHCLAVTSVLVCSLVLGVQSALAAELAAGAPQTYVVQSGDTLWSIAGRFLRDPWLWSEVYEANPGIGDPDLIYPGDVLELRMVGGEPRIRRSRSASGRGSPRVVKLSPQVRSSSLTEAVPTISIAAIGPFLTQPYVADSDDIRRASYVVGFPDEHLIAGVNDSIYVRKIRSADQTDFQVLRPGDELRDPDSNELLGYEAVFVANAALERVGDPAKLKVVRMERQVSIGDRVIPASAEQPLVNFFPKPAPSGTRGRIISVLNGVSQIGRYDVVVLNLGSRDRVSAGDTFEVYVGGGKARDDVRRGMAANDWLKEGPLSSEFWLGQEWERKGWRRDEPSPDSSFPIHADWRRNKGEYVRPFERSGVLMVFRTFDRVSFGIVLHANRFINVGDWIAPPPA